jgi:hypothetical protein
MLRARFECDSVFVVIGLFHSLSRTLDITIIIRVTDCRRCTV